MSAWDIPSKKTAGRGQGLGQDRSQPGVTSSQGHQPSGPELPPQGPALWVWAGLEEMGLEGLTGCSSDSFRSLCHLCLMSLSPHLPQVSPSLLSLQRGAPAGPLSGCSQIWILGDPSILIFTGHLLRANHCVRHDLVLSYYSSCFAQRGEFTCPRLHSP